MVQSSILVLFLILTINNLIYILNGITGKNAQLDGNNHPYIGISAYWDRNNKLFATCTVVLIDEHFVLTGGHCTFPVEGEHFVRGRVWFDSSIHIDTIRNEIGGYKIEWMKHHPNYNGQGDCDIGLLYIKEDLFKKIGSSINIGKLINDNVLQRGYDIELVGYGRSTMEESFGEVYGHAIFLDENGYANRRYVTTTLKSNVVQDNAFPTCDMLMHVNNGNAGSCFGDSGAAMIDYNQEIVLGVNSIGMGSYTTCNGLGWGSYFGDPDASQFIYDYIGQ